MSNEEYRLLLIKTIKERVQLNKDKEQETINAYKLLWRVENER